MEMESLPAPLRSHASPELPAAPVTVRVDPKYPHQVVIRGLDIPFGDLVMLLIKVTVAAIPAAMILAFVGTLVTFLASGFFSAIASMAGRH